MKRAVIGIFFLISGNLNITEATVFAQETSEQTNNTKKEYNKQFQENKEITDNVLKASEGSLSRYSLQFNLSYDGPPIGDLSARDQPNPDGTVSVTATALRGSFGGRYRLSPKDTLNLTAGVSDQYIFHDNQRFDVNNPYFSYQRAFRFYGIQMISAPGVAAITTQTLRNVSEFASVNYALSAVWDLGHSGLALALTGTLADYFFSRPWLKSDGKVRQYNIGLNPTIKYKVTDKFNVYSTLQLAYYNLRSDRPSKLKLKTTEQTFGVGYSFTRDFYFSLFVDFFPSNPALESTTINFSTIFSVF